MKLLVLACLFAVAYAQPTPSEYPPETFMARMEITRYEGENPTKGTGVWDRSAMEEEFMYRDNFMGPSQREVGFESLGLFRTHVRYNIRFEGTNSSCHSEKISENEEFPKVWEWLQDEKTKKTEKTVNGTTYIVYMATLRDETITLEVSSTKPDVPVMETHSGHRGKEEIRYVSFEPMAPPSTVFEPPASCKPPPPPRKGHF